MTTTATSRPGFQAGTWKLDPTHSELAFSARHLGISKVRGRFENFDVTVITTDDGNLSIEATADVASVNTNQEQRDNHLRTSDFFLVEEFPTAYFRSTAITSDGDDITVTGELTLRGVTKEVVFTGELHGVVTGQAGKPIAAVSASTTINRMDFGVNWNAPLEAGGFVLGDNVQLTVELQLVLQ